jgi:virginiamycin B lyase
MSPRKICRNREGGNAMKKTVVLSTATATDTNARRASSLFSASALRRSSVLTAALLLAMAMALPNTASVAAAASTNTVAASKVATHPMSELKVAATIKIGEVDVDWVAVTPEGVWVGSKKPNLIAYVDPNTNKETSIALPGDACAGLAADSQSLWVPLCGHVNQLAKVDLKTRVLTQTFNVGPAGPEGSIAAGAGSVWLITDKRGSLARIDPNSGSIVQTWHVPAGSYNPIFSDGRIWVTRAEGSEVTSVDATTGKILGHFSTGPHPRFGTAGGGAVWSLNQGDGSLSRIDIAGQRPVVTVQLHTPGVGGDIKYADGRIWTTMPKTPLTVVDAATSVVLCRWKGAGGDAIDVGFGTIWLTNYPVVGTVARIALSDLPEDCRAPSQAK